MEIEEEEHKEEEGYEICDSCKDAVDRNMIVKVLDNRDHKNRHTGMNTPVFDAPDSSFKKLCTACREEVIESIRDNDRNFSVEKLISRNKVF